MPHASALRALYISFVLSLFLAAALLFNIQPMIGKMLLPLVGGTPSVWNVAMAFFQMTLLAGYLLAHGLSKVSPLVHGVVYLLLLCGATLLLPIHLPEGWSPSPAGFPPADVLWILIQSVGLPFCALSLSAPTLQRLFAASAHPAGKDPYFLYAASNFGSFLGLLAYPFLLEPFAATTQQAALWLNVYLALLAGVALCLVLLYKLPRATVPDQQAPLETTPTTAPTMARRLTWMAYAAVPSSLTLGVTSYISMDIAATPMLWVVTLGLYLMTYSIAFAQRGAMLRRASSAAQPWLVGLALSLCFFSPFASAMPLIETSLHVLAFVVTAITCHSLLAAARPAKEHLTEFYFWMSLGGALGGAFNAFLAPVLFTALTEYPLALALAFTLCMPALAKRQKRTLVVGLIGFIALGLLSLYGPKDSPINFASTALVALILMTCLLLRQSADKRLALVALGGFVLCSTLIAPAQLFADRNFFGTVLVLEQKKEATAQTLRYLRHGSTTHGVQQTDPLEATMPTAYYSSMSPVAQIFPALQPQSALMIGLGTGALNCYAKAGQRFHFIEIDPLMEHVAKNWFTFLSACPAPEITIGDGRLKLAAEEGRFYDLIVLDAFSSDSIPVHLLTQEAFALYLKHLTANGALIVHISNRFFDLEPLIAGLADQAGVAVLTGQSPHPDNKDINFPSKWVLLSPNKALLENLPRTASADQAHWREARRNPSLKIWQDGYSNPFALLNLKGAYSKDQ